MTDAAANLLTVAIRGLGSDIQSAALLLAESIIVASIIRAIFNE